MIIDLKSMPTMRDKPLQSDSSDDEDLVYSTETELDEKKLLKKLAVPTRFSRSTVMSHWKPLC